MTDQQARLTPDEVSAAHRRLEWEQASANEWARHAMARAHERDEALATVALLRGALEEIANLDFVDLRAHGYSVGDKAIGIAKRALQ